MSEIDKKQVVGLLNRILESELAGVIRYTHYSLLVFGYNRIPIVAWLREQATESLTHAQLAGEMITQLGAYPSLGIGRLLDSHKHDIGKILVESMEHEAAALQLYKDLLSAVEGRSVMLEEYARQMIYAEELHAGEVGRCCASPAKSARPGAPARNRSRPALQRQACIGAGGGSSGGEGLGTGGSSTGAGCSGSGRTGGLPGGDGFPGWPPMGRSTAIDDAGTTAPRRGRSRRPAGIVRRNSGAFHPTLAGYKVPAVAGRRLTNRFVIDTLWP